MYPFAAVLVHHITEPQRQLHFSQVNRFNSVTTSLHSTEAQQGWVGFKPPCHLGSITNYINSARRCPSPSLKFFVKVPIASRHSGTKNFFVCLLKVN